MDKKIPLPVNLIEKLKEKKHRTEKGLFLVEGATSVLELLDSNLHIEHLVVSEAFWNDYRGKLEKPGCPISPIHEGEVKKMSSLEHNISAIAIVKQPELAEATYSKGITIALDGIRDPGNLGTLVRIADWYGIDTIIASDDTTDIYNPKAIAGSMGSFLRTRVIYTNLADYLSNSPVPVFGTYLNGENIHTTDLPKSGILVIGNESNGVSKHISQFIKRKLTIPRFGGAESLNAAIATAVVLDNWRRSLT